MNENQNPNLGNANGVPAPGQAPAPAVPNANPNIVAPGVAPVANPNIATAPVNPVEPAPMTAPAPMAAPAATPALGQAPVEATPAANPSLPGMAPAPAVPQAPAADTNMAAPGMTPAANQSLPGMAPAPGAPVTPVADPNMATPGVAPSGGITIDPNAMGTVTPAPAPTGGPTPEDEDGKRFDTKTIVLVVAAILAVIFAVVYFLFLNPNKKKPAPVNNTVDNTTENVTGNTTPDPVGNTTENTTPEPEKPEEIPEADMGWMGVYTSDDYTVEIYYSAPKVIELNVSKASKNGAASASLSLEVTSLNTIKYDDDYLGEDLKLELVRTKDGISIKAESSDKDSVLNLEADLEKEAIKEDGWSGFYQTDGGQIIINEIYKNGGRIDISAESSKYSNYSTTYELKNDKITIKAKSFTKSDTEIIIDGDNLIVKSDEYLAGTYKKLS